MLSFNFFYATISEVHCIVGQSQQQMLFKEDQGFTRERFILVDYMILAKGNHFEHGGHQHPNPGEAKS